MTEYATKQEARQLARQLTDEYLTCRETNHPWVPHTARRDNSNRCYDRVFRCPRCDTRKIQVISLRGAIITSRYEYPDGYLNRGFGRIVGDARDAMRLESLKRMVGSLPSTNGQVS